MSKKIDYEMYLSKDRSEVRVSFQMSGISKSLVSKIVKKATNKLSRKLGKDLSVKEASEYIDKVKVLALDKTSFWLLDKALIKHKARVLRMLKVNHILGCNGLVLKEATLFREVGGFSVIIIYEGVCFDV